MTEEHKEMGQKGQPDSYPDTEAGGQSARQPAADRAEGRERALLQSQQPAPVRAMNRRQAMTIVGMTGAAAATGVLVTALGGESSVVRAIYGEGEEAGCKELADGLALQGRKLGHLWVDLDEDFPRLETETDDTARFLRAIRHIEDESLSNRKLYLAGSEYTVSATLKIAKRGFRIIGVRQGRPSDPSGKIEGGTRINFTGSGPLFQLGEETSGPYSDTVQGFALEFLTMTYAGTNRQALNNPMAVSSGRGNYGIGTYAVRDFNNGGIQFRDVQIERFEYGFWGVYTDVNSFDNVNLFYNKVGMYIGAGSGQNTLRELYTIGNDTALWLQGAGGVRVQDCQFVKDGSATDAPIVIDSQGVPHDSAFFHRCWFEAGSSHRLQAFVEISCRPGSTPSKGITFRDSYLAVGAKVGGEPVCKYFVQVGNASRIVIDEVSNFPQNLKKLVAFEGSHARQTAVFRGTLDWDYGDGTLYDKLGTGEAKFISETYRREGVFLGESVTVERPRYARVYVANAQPVAASSWTKVMLDTAGSDEWGDMSLSSGTFTARAAGIYMLSVQVQWGQAPQAARVRLALHLNGGAGAFAYLDDATVAAGQAHLAKGSLPVQLAENQTLDIRVWADRIMSVQPGAASTVLSIIKLA